MSHSQNPISSFEPAWDHELTSETGLKEAQVLGDTNEIARGSQGVLRIPGLTRCLGVAVYDHSSGEGYAGHFVAENRSLEDFADVISEFKYSLDTEGVDSYKAEAVAAGLNCDGVIDSHFLHERGALADVGELGAKRAVVEEDFNREYSEASFHWSMDEGYSAEIVLDLDKGEISYDPSFDYR